MEWENTHCIELSIKISSKNYVSYMAYIEHSIHDKPLKTLQNLARNTVSKTSTYNIRTNKKYL
jgi:hypothetical protein